ALHQEKLNKLNLMRKGFFQLVFPKNGETKPRLRFCNFESPWEQRKLGDLVIEQPRPIKMLDFSSYQLVTVKRRNGGIVSRGYFLGKDVLVKSQYEVRTGDFLISKRQVVHGATGLVPKNLDKSIVSNEYLVLRGTRLVRTEFLSLLSGLPEVQKKYFLSSFGIDIEKFVFDFKDWKQRKVYIPSLDEQDRIISFETKLKSTIALHHEQIDKLKKLKKAYLKLMFI
ncbi:MAG: hsdS, partial [Bacillus sp. (in: firmicutes)]|nr:hsdS [Bacillus sp. (in: firmicutes)]